MIFTFSQRRYKIKYTSWISAIAMFTQNTKKIADLLYKSTHKIKLAKLFWRYWITSSKSAQLWKSLNSAYSGVMKQYYRNTTCIASTQFWYDNLLLPQNGNIQTDLGTNCFLTKKAVLWKSWNIFIINHKRSLFDFKHEIHFNIVGCLLMSSFIRTLVWRRVY